MKPPKAQPITAADKVEAARKERLRLALPAAVELLRTRQAGMGAAGGIARVVDRQRDVQRTEVGARQVGRAALVLHVVPDHHQRLAEGVVFAAAAGEAVGLARLDQVHQHGAVGGAQAGGEGIDVLDGGHGMGRGGGGWGVRGREGRLVRTA